MSNLISKVRARKTKSREKQAGRTSTLRSPIAENPFVGLVIVVATWLSTMLIMQFDRIIGAGGAIDWLPVAGDAVFVFLGILATGMYLRIVKADISRRNPRILLLALISLIALIPAKAILHVADMTDLATHQTALFLLPVALAPMLATILISSATGVGVGVWISLVMAVLAGRSFPVFVTGMIATVITAQTARHVRTRGKVFRIGLLIGLSEMACVFSVTAFAWNDSDVMSVLHQALACLVSGLLSAMVVLLILPLFEVLFKITTDITLLELSDMGHPLLQKLAIEAPGTYHHSIVVASLAQSAADEIGANSLEARVCAYFHDLGKLTKPGFFAENIALQNNPHDDLPPSMSTLVITAHVKEGLSLAMLHKLPAPILNAIREHHGTSLLSYFHHKARSQLELALGKETGAGNGQKTVNEADFRYPGPRPSTKVSAIICLADAVEAASRSMEKTTPGHIEGMVSDIVNTRFEDGQLDECDLTLRDLTRVKRSFVFTLTNMLHGRIPYPKDENRDKQQPKPAPDKQAEAKGTGQVSNGQGS